MGNIFAEFISPAVSHLHHSDPTFNQLCCKQHSNTKFSLFEEILAKYFIAKLKSLASDTAKGLSKLESQKNTSIDSSS